MEQILPSQDKRHYWSLRKLIIFCRRWVSEKSVQGSMSHLFHLSSQNGEKTPVFICQVQKCVFLELPPSTQQWMQSSSPSLQILIAGCWDLFSTRPKCKSYFWSLFLPFSVMLAVCSFVCFLIGVDNSGFRFGLREGLVFWPWKSVFSWPKFNWSIRLKANLLDNCKGLFYFFCIYVKGRVKRPTVALGILGYFGKDKLIYYSLTPSLYECTN